MEAMKVRVLIVSSLLTLGCGGGDNPVDPEEDNDETVDEPTGQLQFQSVSAGRSGADHSCGVTTAGAAYCWGDNTWAQLGNGTSVDSNVPVAVSGGLTFQSVSVGIFHSCGVTTAGAAYCWGIGGLLGDGTNTTSNVPVAVSGGLNFQSLSVGFTHSCGVTTTAAGYCWGSNTAGQFGDGTNTDSNVPVRVGG